MSHWRDVKCELKCSLDVMRRALLKINPEWERHMEISADGRLSIDNQYTGERARGGYHIRVKGNRGGGARDLPYADLGLKKEADGTWAITVDPVGAEHVRNLQGFVTAQVEQLRAIAQAQMNGDRVLNAVDVMEGDGTTVTDIEVEVDDSLMI